MSLKIKNPYYKTQVEIDAEALSPAVVDALKANAQNIGQVASLAEIRRFLTSDDETKLTRQVFNQVCQINGFEIINPTDPAS